MEENTKNNDDLNLELENLKIEAAKLGFKNIQLDDIATIEEKITHVQGMINIEKKMSKFKAKAKIIKRIVIIIIMITVLATGGSLVETYFDIVLLQFWIIFIFLMIIVVVLYTYMFIQKRKKNQNT